MTITPAAITDLDDLAKLFDAYRVWYRKETDLTRAKIFLAERINKKESIIYLAKEESGTCLAFTQLYPIFSSVRMRRMWLLNDLFVAPAHRGKGISKALIKAAQELARNTDAAGVLLETEQSNTIGNILYPKMGFELEENNFYFWTNVE